MKRAKKFYKRRWFGRSLIPEGNYSSSRPRKGELALWRLERKNRGNLSELHLVDSIDAACKKVEKGAV